MRQEGPFMKEKTQGARICSLAFKMKELKHSMKRNLCVKKEAI
jgi:hypothetical protein